MNRLKYQRFVLALAMYDYMRESPGFPVSEETIEFDESRSGALLMKRLEIQKAFAVIQTLDELLGQQQAYAEPETSFTTIAALM